LDVNEKSPEGSVGVPCAPLPPQLTPGRGIALWWVGTRRRRRRVGPVGEGRPVGPPGGSGISRAVRGRSSCTLSGPGPALGAPLPLLALAPPLGARG